MPDAAIVQKESPVLRLTAEEIPARELTSPALARVVKAMKKALDSQEDGVAIAAPQIGESLRIFVVSEKVFDLSDDAEHRREAREDMREKKYGHLVFINPTLLKLSRKKEWLEEGCLSVRWLYGKVQRSIKATVRAYDEKGRFFERGASGLMAQVFQHEMDHLDGVLFIDKAREVREMAPEDITA